MKKIDLIHTTILILAAIAGYQAVQYIIGMFSVIVFLNDNNMFRQVAQQLTYSLIFIIAYAILCIVLVKNGRKYAGLMLKDDPEGSWEDAPKWDLDRRSILLALFIGLGIYTLLQAIPGLGQDVYLLFQEKVNVSVLVTTAKKDTLIVELLKALLGFFLIYAAPALTNYTEKTIAVRLDTKEDSGS